MKATCKKPRENRASMVTKRSGLYKTYKAETANGFPIVIELYNTDGKTGCNFWLATRAGCGDKTKRQAEAVAGGEVYHGHRPENNREPAALILALANGGITLSDETKSDHLAETFIPDAIRAIAIRFDFCNYRLLVDWHK